MARVPNVASERQRRDTVTDNEKTLWEARRDAAAVLAWHLASQIADGKQPAMDVLSLNLLNVFIDRNQQYEAACVARKEAR